MASQATLHEHAKHMTFGIELECIAVYKKGLFDADENNHHNDVIAALSLGCDAKYLEATGHEHADDDIDLTCNNEPFSQWVFKEEGGLHLSAKERETLGPNLDEYEIVSLEVSSRKMSFSFDNLWREEIETVLSVFKDLQKRGVRFITNSTTGFHIHIGLGETPMPLRTAKSVLELCVAFEDRLDALYSIDRIDEKAAAKARQGCHFNASLAWHFLNNTSGTTPYGPNVFHWLTAIEESSTFEQLGNFFRNEIPSGVRKTNAHYSMLNLDNLYQAPSSSEEPDSDDPTGTIEFRQHSGTLNLEAIVAHVLFKKALVSFCHTVADKEFLQLIAQASNPNFRVGDLMRAIGGPQELLEYHAQRCSYANIQEKEIEFQQTTEDLNNGKFKKDPLVKLSAQSFVETYQRRNCVAVSSKIHAKHKAGAYAKFDRRDLDIAGEWDSFVWGNCSAISGEELAIRARTMVFQQLNGDDKEFDCDPSMFSSKMNFDDETDPEEMEM